MPIVRAENRTGLHWSAADGAVDLPTRGGLFVHQHRVQAEAGGASRRGHACRASADH